MCNKKNGTGIHITLNLVEFCKRKTYATTSKWKIGSKGIGRDGKKSKDHKAIHIGREDKQLLVGAVVTWSTRANEKNRRRRSDILKKIL